MSKNLDVKTEREKVKIEEVKILSEAEKLARIGRSTLMDDAYMRVFFEDNIPCTELVLRIIMNKADLKVKSVRTQKRLMGIKGARSVILDVYAVDSNNTEYDIEVQRGNTGASPQRARYHSAMIDANILKSGHAFNELRRRESVVIFITENDVLGGDEPIYIIERVDRKTGAAFNDGTHIIYVNASKNVGKTDLSKLMHDFTCPDADKMNYNLLARRTEIIKKNSKGAKLMGVWDEMYQEAMELGKKLERENAMKSAKQYAEKREKIARREMREHFLMQLLKTGERSIDKLAMCSGMRRDSLKKFAAKNGYSDLV